MSDPQIYDQVAQEVSNGDIKPGLWARAFSDAEGDESRAKALYIRLRATELEQIAADAERGRRKARRAESLNSVQGTIGAVLLIAGIAFFVGGLLGFATSKPTEQNVGMLLFALLLCAPGTALFRDK